MSPGPEGPTVEENVTRGHYDRLAATYDENWAHTTGFVAWMTSFIRQRLRIADGDLVADIGCGTGLYARGLVPPAAAVVCAEPSQALLAQVPAEERLIPVAASAEDLVAERVVLPHAGYDAIVLKEVLHHVAGQAAVIAGLARLLRPGGRMLVVQMVRNRYMSLLSYFDDAQLEAGVADPGGLPGPVRRTQRRAVGRVGGGHDVAGVVPGDLTAGAAADGWHQPDVRKADPATACPWRRSAAGAAVLGAAAAR